MTKKKIATKPTSLINEEICMDDDKKRTRIFWLC